MVIGIFLVEAAWTPEGGKGFQAISRPVNPPGKYGLIEYSSGNYTVCVKGYTTSSRGDAFGIRWICRDMAGDSNSVRYFDDVLFANGSIARQE